MDWNWFFSSMAQSAAAIAGIFSAFIITKTLNSKVSFLEKCGRIESAITKARSFAARAENRRFSWYNKKQELSALHDLEELFLESEGQINLDNLNDLYLKLGFSPFQKKEEAMSALQSALAIMRKNEELKREAEKAKAQAEDEIERDLKSTNFFTSHQATMKRIFLHTEHFNRIPSLPSPGLITTDWTKVSDERELIDSLGVEIKHHREDIKHLLESIKENPEYSKEVEASLLVVTLLFFVGVVWPLSFLPVSTGSDISISLSAFIPTLFSLKGLLLGVFALVFVFIPIIFFRLNRSLKYSPVSIKSLDAFTEAKAYSVYYKYEEDYKRSALAGNLRGG